MSFRGENARWWQTARQTIDEERLHNVTFTGTVRIRSADVSAYGSFVSFEYSKKFGLFLGSFQS